MACKVPEKSTRKAGLIVLKAPAPVLCSQNKPTFKSKLALKTLLSRSGGRA